jgi:hypothetical protein
VSEARLVLTVLYRSSGSSMITPSPTIRTRRRNGCCAGKPGETCRTERPRLKPLFQMILPCLNRVAIDGAGHRHVYYYGGDGVGRVVHHRPDCVEGGGSHVRHYRDTDERWKGP